MMPKKVMLLVNPEAGKGGYKTALPKIVRVLCANDCLPTVYMMQGSGDGRALAARDGGAYDLICCVGGDGTLSEVVNGMMCLKSPPPLGYIPMGTANDIATTLKLPRSSEKAAERVIKGRPIAFDVGLFGDLRYFAYIAAFGAFTEVAYETSQEAKRSLGQLAYVLEGINRLTRLNHYRAVVEHDDGVIVDDFVFGGVTNSTSVAGMLRLNPGFVDLGDGLFEIILVKNPRNIAEAGELLTKNLRAQCVTTLHSRRVRFTFESEVAWTLDGEAGGLHKDVVLENPHTPIQIIV